MANKNNHNKQYYIFIKEPNRWDDVNKEFYTNYSHDINAYRKRQQEHSRCVCHASKRYLCDTYCLTYPHAKTGGQLSLINTINNDDGKSERDCGKEIRRFNTAVYHGNNLFQKLRSKIDAVDPQMKTIGNSIIGVGKKMMGVTTIIIRVGVAIVKTTADFGSAISQVSAVSGTTGKDIDALRNKARELGTNTKFSAIEAAQAMSYMAMAGWKTEDILSGIEDIMNLAVASGKDLTTTFDIVADALIEFKLSAKDSGHFADILVATSSNANININMMVKTFQYCAPIAGALGFSFEDTAKTIGIMANAGIKSSQLGAVLHTIMSSLAGEIKIKGKTIGDIPIATTNADGSMRDLSVILANCRSAFGNLTESEKKQAAESLVGKNIMFDFLALINASKNNIEKLSFAIDNCDGSAKKMAMTMQDNLSGQLTILKSQFQNLAISFGDILIPVIRSIVSKLQDFVDKLNGMDEGTKRFLIIIALLIASIGPLLISIGASIPKIHVALRGFVKLINGISKLKVVIQCWTK